MDRSEQLWCVEQIKVVKARYFQALDGKDWVAMAELFHPLCTSEFAPHWRFETGSEFVAHLSALPLGPTSHRGHDPIVEVVSPTEAHASFGVADTLHYLDQPDREYQGFGRYHDTFVGEGGRWLFSSWSFVRHFGRG